MIPKGMATSGLLAHTLTAKFEDAQPFLPTRKDICPDGNRITPGDHVRLGNQGGRSM